MTEFERQVGTYLGTGHAIGCGNGTDALVLALRACGIGRGDEVITTPFSFFATAEAIAAVGATPVFTDIRESDYCMDAARIQEKITAKTKAILPVHIFGGACDMDEIMETARKYGLRVIEDTAQGIGASYKGKKLGTIGDIGCFSFYPTKNLGCCGDGGLVITDDDDLSTILLALREHGGGETGARARFLLGGEEEELTTDEAVTELYNPYKYYNYLIAYNSRLDAIQAAILSVKLRYLDEFNRKRADIARMYSDMLTSCVRLPHYPEDTIPCWHQYVICTEKKAELCKYLSEEGIGNGTFYPVPLHRQKAFETVDKRIAETVLPVAEKTASQSVCLPIFPEMTEEQTEYVIQTVNRFFEEKA